MIPRWTSTPILTEEAMKRRWPNLSRNRLVVILGSGVCLALACIDNGKPSGPSAVQAGRPAAPASAVVLTPEQQARVDAARARVTFAGRIHNEAMRELTANRKQWLAGGEATLPARCAALARVVAKYAPVAFAEAGASVSPEEIQLSVRRAVTSQTRCTDSQIMSVIGALYVGPLRIRATQTSEDVTGEYESHVNAIAGGAQSTDGTPPAVSGVTSSVLAGAASIPANDLTVVAAAADLTYGSSVEWTAFFSPGGGGCDPECPPMTSVVRANAAIPLLALIVGVDALGCAAGAASSFLGGERRASYLVGQCVIWGAAGSGGAALAAM